MSKYNSNVQHVRCCYISALVLTCFRLKKGRATFFLPETIVASFLHLMVLFFKVLLSHLQNVLILPCIQKCYYTSHKERTTNFRLLSPLLLKFSTKILLELGMRDLAFIGVAGTISWSGHSPMAAPWSHLTQSFNVYLSSFFGARFLVSFRPLAFFLAYSCVLTCHLRVFLWYGNDINKWSKLFKGLKNSSFTALFDGFIKEMEPCYLNLLD